MSADAQVAQLVATIADLRRQVSDAQAETAQVKGQLTRALSDLAASSGQVAALQTNISTMSAEAQQTQVVHERALADKDSAVTAATAATAALAKKFDQLYGEVTPGIRRGPPHYLTDDNLSHPTLRAAQVHQIALSANVSDQAAQRLIDNRQVLVPLIQGA